MVNPKLVVELTILYLGLSSGRKKRYNETILMKVGINQ